MNVSSWTTGLERADTSYLLLATLAGLMVAAGILYQIGLIGSSTWSGTRWNGATRRSITR